MQIFKKTLFGALLFLACVSLISVPCISSYYSFINESTAFPSDYKKYDGKINTLFLGSSNTRVSVDVEKYDMAFRTNSYSFTSNRMYMPANYYSLCKVLETNKIKKLYLELSYDNLFDDPYGAIESTLNYYEVVDDNIDKITYMIQYGGVKNYLKIYGYMLNNGGKILINNQIHNAYLFYKKISTDNQYIEEPEKNNPPEICKGFAPKRSEQFTEFSRSDFKQFYHSQSRQNTKINSVQKKYLNKIVELCEKNNIEITFIVYPVTNYFTILYDNNHIFENAENEINKEYGYPIWDFNLIAEKSEVFFDNEDFYNQDHMSYAGAEKFSGLLIQIEKSSDTSIFCESYDSLEENIMKSIEVV